MTLYATAPAINTDHAPRERTTRSNTALSPYRKAMRLARGMGLRKSKSSKRKGVHLWAIAMKEVIEA
jgi:hypothetical protein